MPSSVAVTKIVDDQKATTIKIDITGAASSDLTLATVFNPASYFNTGVHKRIRKIQYCLNGFSGQLYWAGSSNVPLITMEQNHYSEADYKEIGYLNNSSVTAPTGVILLSTLGLTTNLTGYIILYIESRDTQPGTR